MLKHLYPPRRTNKIRGSALLITAIIAAAIITLISISIAKTTQVSLNSLTSSKNSIQSQHYADAKMSLLKNQDYYDIKSQIKTTIPNSNFQDEVVVGSEITNSDNTKEKLVTINVYKQGNNIPQFTLKRSFSSKETSQTNIGNPEWLGSTNGGSIKGTAKEAGFIVAAGSSKPYSLNVYVNGKLLGYVVPRGYGTGDIQVCVPVPKGSSWSISGKCSWAYWMSLK